MYAIIETGGKQYKISEGSLLNVEKIDAQPGENIILDKVLLVSNNDDNKIIGHPYVEGAKIFAKVVSNLKSKKIIVFKYKPKKRYRIKRGHRQHLTRLKISSITI